MQISAETVLEFMSREGAVSTWSLSTRFGLDMMDTRKMMNRLRRQGLVESRREIFDYCAMNGWRLTEKGRNIIGEEA